MEKETLPGCSIMNVAIYASLPLLWGPLIGMDPHTYYRHHPLDLAQRPLTTTEMHRTLEQHNTLSHDQLMNTIQQCNNEIRKQVIENFEIAHSITYLTQAYKALCEHNNDLIDAVKQSKVEIQQLMMQKEELTTDAIIAKNTLEYYKRLNHNAAVSRTEMIKKLEEQSDTLTMREEMITKLEQQFQNFLTIRENDDKAFAEQSETLKNCRDVIAKLEKKLEEQLQDSLDANACYRSTIQRYKRAIYCLCGITLGACIVCYAQFSNVFAYFRHAIQE